jgi:hypothetical protein
MSKLWDEVDNWIREKINMLYNALEDKMKKRYTRIINKINNNPRYSAKETERISKAFIRKYKPELYEELEFNPIKPLNTAEWLLAALMTYEKFYKSSENSRNSY